MIDESRFVSIDGSIYHYIVVDGEEVSVMPLAMLVRIPCVSLGGGEPLSGVFDETRAGLDAPHREGTATLDRRFANLERKFYCATLVQEGYL